MSWSAGCGFCVPAGGHTLGVGHCRSFEIRLQESDPSPGLVFDKPPLDLSCNGGSHMSAFTLGKATGGHEPEGVPKNQENAQVQEPPIT